MTVSRVRFKRTDLELSLFVAGCWRLTHWQKSRAELDKWIKSCVNLGVTSFDLADVYGGGTCESIFGQAFDPKLRDRVQLITKCGIRPPSERHPGVRVKHYDTSCQHIIASVENSLSALGTDHLDVLLLHRPDPLMCAEEIADAFHKLTTSGKVLYFGVSNFKPRQLDLLASSVNFPLVTNQVQVSLCHTNSLFDGTLDQSQRLGMQPMAWSPLGGGVICTDQDASWQRLRVTLDAVAERLGATREQVALAWLVRHPSGILPILGTGNLDRTKAQIEAERVTLDRQDWFELLEAAMGQPVP
jgi:predicted oxidoreductase